MNKETSWWLWQNVCVKYVGIDGNGDEISELTPIAGAAIALGVPVYKYDLPDNRKKVAEFLRGWAEALES